MWALKISLNYILCDCNNLEPYLSLETAHLKGKNAVLHVSYSVYSSCVSLLEMVWVSLVLMRVI